MKLKVLHQIKVKGNNKRISVALLEPEEGEKFFIVRTKTLISFKERNILETETAYSVETFAVLKDLFVAFLDNGEIKNKLILKELNNITPFKANSTFKF